MQPIVCLPSPVDTTRESDLELTRRLLAGHPAAWREFVARFDRRIRAQCRRVGGHGADLEDMMQTTYLQVLQSAGNYAGRGPLDAWVLRLARWTALKLRIHRPSGPRAALFAMHSDPDAAERAENSLDDVVRRLPPRYRDVVVLHYEIGFSVDETAAQLACSPNTVKSRLKRSLCLLRQELHAGP